MKFYFLILSIVVSLIACKTTSEITPVSAKFQPVKNIIFVVVDGMGLTHLSSGIYSNHNTSSFERFKSLGLQKPYSGNRLITDSAAGATAFACGQKTYNGAIAVDMDTMPLPTILEEAEKRHLATGLIVTSSITHATPACFISHNRSRTNYEEIAIDFLKTDIDYFVGGGKKYFANREMDSRNLISELKTKGYQVDDFFNVEFDEVKIDVKKNFAYFTSNEEPLPFAQGRNYLINAVNKGLDHLSKRSENGFFLMVEGSQVDWGGHANNISYILSEWNEINQVIGNILDWSKENKNTLVVITADHETGGLAIQPESKMDSISVAFTSKYHTGTMVPVFAAGPHEDLFQGIYENTSIYFKMRQAFGWDDK